MPRKKAAAAAAAGAQDTVDSLRTKLDEQREHYETQSAQALKLLEQKDAELAALQGKMKRMMKETKNAGRGRRPSVLK